MDRAAQVKKAEAFAKLHKPGDPVVLVNIWDVASAGAVVKAGAKAIATSSVALAQAQGFDDSELLPRERLVMLAERIAAVHDLPLTVDAEAGYGRTGEEVGETARLLMAAGAVGMNLEDQVMGEERLYDVADAAARVAGIRKAADKMSLPFVLNARTDIFLKAPREQHSAQHAEAALERGRAFAKAGASCFFVPGLRDLQLLERICAGSPLPVNVIAGPQTPPLAELAKAGVARISLGGWPYRAMLAGVEALAKDAMRGTFRTF